MNKRLTATKSKEENILSLLLSGKAEDKYKGKQVVIFDGEVHILPEDDQEAVHFVAKLREKKPKVTPILAFVPREETYILFLKL